MKLKALSLMLLGIALASTPNKTFANPLDTIETETQDNETSALEIIIASSESSTNNAFVQQTIDVSTVEELKNALENGHNVNLLNDIILTETLNLDFSDAGKVGDYYPEPSDDKEVSITINGNGHTIKGENFETTENNEIRLNLIRSHIYSSYININSINFDNINIESDSYTLDLYSSSGNPTSISLNQGTKIKNTELRGRNILINGAIIEGLGISASNITFNSGIIRNVKKIDMGCNSYRFNPAISYSNSLTLNSGKIENCNIAINIYENMDDDNKSLTLKNIELVNNEIDFDIAMSNNYNFNIENSSFSYLNNLSTLSMLNSVLKNKNGEVIESPNSYDKNHPFFKLTTSHHASIEIKNKTAKAFLYITPANEKRDNPQNEKKENVYALTKIVNLKLNGKTPTYEHAYDQDSGLNRGGMIRLNPYNENYILTLETTELNEPVFLRERTKREFCEVDDSSSSSSSSDNDSSSSSSSGSGSSYGGGSSGKVSGGGSRVSGGGGGASKKTTPKTQNSNAVLNTKNNVITNKTHALKGTWLKENSNWKLDIGNKTFASNQWAKINNKWYIFDKNSIMLTGFAKVNNTPYYFAPSGEMLTGFFLHNNSWYYANANGDLVSTSFILYKGKWYYLDADYTMLTNKWVKYKDKWYYLKTDGSLAVNETTPDGYKVDKDGAWIK